MTPIQHVDQAWNAFRAELITRDEAIAEIRVRMRVTEVGAAELLDNPRLPSTRRTS